MAAAAETHEAKTTAMLDLLHDLSHGFVLRERWQRNRMEATAKRGYDAFDVSYPWVHRDPGWQVLRTVLGDGDLVAALHADHEKSQSHADFHLETRDTVRGYLASLGDPITRSVRRWYEEPTALVDEWCLDYMRARPDDLGLSEPEDRWPPPREIASLWNYVAYSLAHIMLVATHQLKPHKGDLRDGDYYSDAAYADVLVTDDRGLRRIIAEIPNNRVEVLRLGEFLDTVPG